MRILMMGLIGSKTFLERLAEDLRSETLHVDLCFDHDRPSHFKDWAQTDILVIYGLPCDAADLNAAPGLRAIIVPSTGHEGIDIDAAAARGIAVANGKVPENSESVAEAAFLLMLTALYDIDAARDRLRLNAQRSGAPTARMLKGKTVGIIGNGNIARALIDRLAGWNVEILVHCRRPFPSRPGISHATLDKLLTESEIVLPLVSLTQDTHHLLSRSRLLSMKPGAILVNLSRGAIIEEAALSERTVQHHLGTIALDVFETEPLPQDSPLRTHEKAILTGHDIAHTRESVTALFDMALSNIRAAIAGKEMPTVIRTASR